VTVYKCTPLWHIVWVIVPSRNILVRTMQIKYIINVEVYFIRYLYIMDLINTRKMEHIEIKNCKGLVPDYWSSIKFHVLLSIHVCVCVCTCVHACVHVCFRDYWSENKMEMHGHSWKVHKPKENTPIITEFFRGLLSIQVIFLRSPSTEHLCLL
jgi:hypothetical protein